MGVLVSELCGLGDHSGKRREVRIGGDFELLGYARIVNRGLLSGQESMQMVFRRVSNP